MSKLEDYKPGDKVEVFHLNEWVDGIFLDLWQPRGNHVQAALVSYQYAPPNQNQIPWKFRATTGTFESERVRPKLVPPEPKILDKPAAWVRVGRYTYRWKPSINCINANEHSVMYSDESGATYAVENAYADQFLKDMGIPYPRKEG